MTIKHLGLVSGLVGLCLSCSAIASVPDTFEAERGWFIDAQKALEQGKLEQFQMLRAKLDGYPIAHYLDFLELRQQFAKATPAKKHVARLNQFEADFKDDYLTGKLTRQLQKRAADQRQWSLFQGLKKSRLAADMPCASLQAQAALGTVNTLNEPALSLWTEAKKRPKACTALLNELEQKATPPIKSIWQRIYSAVDEGQPDFAESVVHYLGKRDAKPVKGWLAARKNPAPYLKSGALKQNTAFNRRALVDLVLVWSKEDPVSAMNYWLEVKDRYTFFKDRYYDTHRLLAMRGAYRRLPEAYDWLNSLEGRSDDLELKEWRIRAALYEQDWVNVLRSLKRLPAEEQVEDHWAYWEARALEEAGHLPQAEAIYNTLSKLPTYHGFLAADKIGADYAIKDKPVTATSDQLREVETLSPIIRAREYFQVDIPWEGRREWNAVLKDASPKTLEALTVLATQWQLHDRAIFSAAKADRRQALTQRFPVMFESEVGQAAAKNRIPTAWVYGVMRRESGYIRDAKSSAGAIGLMQLMPNTAKYVAKLQGDKNWRGDLTDAATNIGFGTFYLRHVMDKFDDHQVLATASYNAGPRRVTIWLPPEPMNADVWIDAIPYTETRRYVRAVLAYTAIYEWHLTKSPARLSDKLKIIPAAEGT